MLENPTLPENPAEKTAQAVSDGGSPGGDGLKGEQQGEEGERNTGVNRWPREETMALLKIRSEMDAAFRDVSPKAPLWEQISRKLAELGYNRSAKKCKEKFENIHKYYRRTKEGRSGKKPNGKTYRFFEQMEALNPPHQIAANPIISNNGTVHVIQDAVPCSIVRFPNSANNMADISTSSATTSSSSKGSGEGNKKSDKKRRLTQFFEGLMKEVIEKQETLQRKFMEVLEKCEQERMAREQKWKTEELARIKRERELLAQERSIAAAKDEAVLAFLRKFAENNNGSLHLPENTTQATIPLDDKEKEKEKEQGMQEGVVDNGCNVVDKDNDKDKQECGNNNNAISVGNFVHMSSSRWPKDEVEALIRLRTQLDVQHQGNNNVSNKGPLWEEISSAMKGLGYDRSAKRCKEKWENINKYFKRMKEKNKRKPEDSKTCPYYHHLEALYSKRPKNKVDESGGSSGNELKPEELLMHIMGSGQEQEQKQKQQQQQIESSSEDADNRENTDQNNEEDGYHQMVENSPSIAIMG